MTSPDPTLAEELAFQLAQIAEARRRGHATPAALARFHARARANLTALTRQLPPASPASIEGQAAWPAKWPAKQKPSA